MAEYFKLLIQLQEKDVAIDDISVKLEQLPAEIEAQKMKLEEEKNSFETFKTEGKKFILIHKDKEGQLDEKEKEIIKFSQELNAIKTNEAYRAMLTQIEGAKKQQSLIEDEVLELMEKNDQFNKKIKTVEAEHKQNEASANQEIKNIEDTITSLKSRLSVLSAEREEFVKTVPSEPLKVYEHIRKGKGGLAIVPILENASCSGCHYKLPPQKINEAAKMHYLTLCENCSRIVYYVPQSTPSESKT